MARAWSRCPRATFYRLLKAMAEADTSLDVLVILDDGVTGRAELTIAVERRIAAAVEEQSRARAGEGA
jgi:hypothetical protein